MEGLGVGRDRGRIDAMGTVAVERGKRPVRDGKCATLIWTAAVAMTLCSCAGSRGGIKGSEDFQLTRQEAASRAFQEGLTEFQKGRIKEAIEAWNRSLILNPE